MTADRVPGPIADVSRSKHEAKRWYTRLSPWYAQLSEPIEGPARRRGLEALAPGPGEQILDVGCGPGIALQGIAKAVGAAGEPIGIDIAEGMCEEAALRLEATGLDNGSIVQGDATDLPFRDDVFDGLFVSFVLELLETGAIPQALSEWSRVLAPDGRLCVVALSRREGGVFVRAYEALRAIAPVSCDCRPIYLRETLQENGFVMEESVTRAIRGVPIEIARATPGPKT